MKTKLLLILISICGITHAQSVQSCIVTAGPSATICLGQSSAILIASANPTATSYSWTPGTGLSCTTCPNPTATPTASQTYTVHTTDGNGCSATATVPVTVASIPFVSAIAGATICEGDSTGLYANTSNGQAPYIYFWIPPNSLNNPNFQNPLAAPVTTTNFTVIVTDANGCTAKTTTTVTVNFCNGVQDISFNESVKISPNPTNGVFTIQITDGITQKTNGEIEIYNVLGEKIYQSPIPLRQSVIDISSQPSGLYFLIIKTDKESSSQKLILQK